MGHSEKVIVMVSVFFIAWVSGQALDSSLSNNANDVTPPNLKFLNFVEAMPQDSEGNLSLTDKIKNSVRILDFVQLVEEKHEVEFILDLVQGFPHHFNETMVSSERLDSKLLSFRKLEILQANTSPGKGGLRKVRRVKVTIPCRMKYSLYPYDRAECTFVFVPGGEAIGTWGSSSASIAPAHVELCPGGMSANEFSVKGYLPVILPGGNTTGVDMLSLSLLIKRTSGTQILSQMYSPVASLVIISFLAMNRGSHAFRIGVSCGCLFFITVTSAICWFFIPRDGDDQTATEYYLTFCIGFTWEVVFTNIFIYRYLLNDEDSNDEANSLCHIEANAGKPATNDNGIDPDEANPDGKTKPKSKLKISPNEMHILKMGRFHQYIYFKVLRPAYWHLALLFLIFNVVFFAVVLSLASGLPKGFISIPEPKNELEQLCL